MPAVAAHTAVGSASTFLEAPPLPSGTKWPDSPTPLPVLSAPHAAATETSSKCTSPEPKEDVLQAVSG